ncbi:hypothetical protein [Sinimarinibacterium flocculans]|nr:hypothetical protein [Sinimarinibacterium flocculans]
MKAGQRRQITMNRSATLVAFVSQLDRFPEISLHDQGAQLDFDPCAFAG